MDLTNFFQKRKYDIYFNITNRSSSENALNGFDQFDLRQRSLMFWLFG